MPHCNQNANGVRGRTLIHPADCTGFTLLELVVSLLLLGVLTAIFGMGLVGAMQSHEFSRGNAQLTQKAHLAMNRISRELSELTEIETISNPAGGQDPFILYRRLMRNNQQNTSRMGLHYHRGDGTLRLYTEYSGAAPLDASTIGSGDLLANGVEDFRLTYYQGDPAMVWNPASDFRLLSTIEIDLTLERPEDSSRSVSFNTLVHLRNTRNYGGATPTARPVSRDSYSCFIRTASADRALNDNCRR